MLPALLAHEADAAVRVCQQELREERLRSRIEGGDAVRLVRLRGPQLTVSPAGRLGSPVTGTLIVASDARGSWRAALPFAVMAAVFGMLGLGTGDALGFVFPVVAIVVGVARAAFWYRCGDDSLWDDGVYLMWARGGRVVGLVAWGHMRSATIWYSKIPPEWSGGRYKGGGALPEVMVSSRVAPEGNAIDRGAEYQFATLVLIRRAQVEAAEECLSAACRAHGIVEAAERQVPWRTHSPDGEK